jgi:cyanophycin synthetase
MGKPFSQSLADVSASLQAAEASAIKPVTVVERAIYRGPHLYSHLPMIRIQLDLGHLEIYPSDRLPGFADALMALMPGLAAHGCSYHEAGGFERRLREGTWLGHITEHVALELQTMAGQAVSRGKTRSVKGRPGHYNMLFAYRDEEVGVRAGAHALRLVCHLLPRELQGLRGLDILKAGDWEAEPFDLNIALADLKRLVDVRSLGPTTRSLVEEAERRGIPVLRLDENSLVQFGYGSRQRRIRASITSQTSHIAVETAGDKALTKRFLLEAGLPAPKGVVVRTAEGAVAAAAGFNGPVVTKPLDANHGRGVSVGLTGPDEVHRGFEHAAQHGRRVVVEEMLHGRDHRFLVVDGRVVAVAERLPASVVGDGRSRIEDLVALENENPKRGAGHEKMMTRITIDDHVIDCLAKQAMSLESVPSAGEQVLLRATANLSTGGSAIDRTETAHPDNVAIAEQAAALIGLDVAGVDFVLPDVTKSVRETGGGIVEINAAPGFRMHLEPSIGLPRSVAAPVLRSLFPRGSAGRIPIFAITGTNGKSTTTRMLARILRATGLNLGLTSTSGIYFNDRLIIAADASGPKSARMVLRNPKVDAAVFEVARGGMLREGLGFDVCDVGAVLNVTEDHLGAKGVETLSDLAAVKSIVVESVRRRGHSVLNADDPLTVGMQRHARGSPVFFSMRGGEDMAPFLQKHVAEGGLAVIHEPTVRGGDIIIYRDGERALLMSAGDIPATLHGAARFNVENALAAVAMAAAHGVDPAVIREALSSFSSSYEQNPGRLNFYEGHPFRVLVDYAHNPAGLSALAGLLERLRPAPARKIGMVSVPGDRRDDDIRAVGAAAAGMFDEIVFRENPDCRGRPRGEISALMTEGAIAAGADPRRLHRIYREQDAAQACLEMADPGDLVVLLPTAVSAIWQRVLEFDPAPARRPQGRVMEGVIHG